MLQRMKLATKLISSFTVLVAIAVIIGAVAIFNMAKLGTKTDGIYTVNLMGIIGLGHINDGQNYTALATADLIDNRLFMDTEIRKAAFDAIPVNEKLMQDGMDIYAPLEQTTEEKALWDQYMPVYEKWKEQVKETVALATQKAGLIDSGVDQNDERVTALNAQMAALDLETRVTFAENTVLFDQVVKINQDGAKESYDGFVAMATQARTLMFIIIGVGVLIAVALGIYFTSNVRGIINTLIAEAKKLADAAINGQLATRGNLDIINLEFRPIVVGVNDTLDAVIGPLNVAAEYVDRISNGDIPPKITDEYNGDFNEIKNNLNKCIDAVNMLVADADMLSKAAVEGKLATRADASKHGGDFGKIVTGVNETLDAVIGPLNVAAEYVDKISKGDIPAKISDNYNGDFNEIKNNLNRCIDAVNLLVADADLLSKAAVDGKLATRADASKHGGDFGKIVVGVNDTLDAVIGPLNVAAEYVDRISKGDIPAKISDTYNGDFNEIKNNLNSCIGAVNGLVADAGMLSKAALEGKLATRADATKHQGDFQKIVQGVNDTLDAVVGPINEAAEVLAATAKKDMTKRVKGDYKGQLAELKENINQAIENLDQTLGQVTEAVDQVMSGGNQISSGSQSLAEGANEQASSLEEISSSLEEMSSMTKQNAENANQAKSLAETARLSAVKGNEAMKRMEAAIQHIKASSDQTAKIVKTIDEIAFQTNLLALNAAVEAARAGEAGMGFAVVAEEVRNLAQRSAEAAKNTANMIEESVKNAEGGVKITEEVAKTLAEIVEGSGKVNMLVAEIAAASSEQSKGIEQVNVGVVQMNKVTQQNAANSEESAAAAEELSGQATELGSLVRSFVLSTSGGTGMVRQAAGRPVMEPKGAQTHAVHHGEPALKGQAQALSKVVKNKKGGNGPVAHVLKPEKIIPFREDADDALSKF